MNYNSIIGVAAAVAFLVLVAGTELQEWFKESLQCDNINQFSFADPVIIGGLLQSAYGASIIVLLGLVLCFGGPKTTITKAVLFSCMLVGLMLTSNQYESGARSIERIVAIDAQQYNIWVCERRN